MSGMGRGLRIAKSLYPADGRFRRSVPVGKGPVAVVPVDRADGSGGHEGRDEEMLVPRMHARGHLVAEAPCQKAPLRAGINRGDDGHPKMGLPSSGWEDQPAPRRTSCRKRPGCPHPRKKGDTRCRVGHPAGRSCPGQTVLTGCNIVLSGSRSGCSGGQKRSAPANFHPAPVRSERVCFAAEMADPVGVRRWARTFA